MIGARWQMKNERRLLEVVGDSYRTTLDYGNRVVGCTVHPCVLVKAIHPQYDGEAYELCEPDDEPLGSDKSSYEFVRVRLS